MIHAAGPGGAAAYFSELATWHHTAIDALMVTQEIIGDAIAVRARK